MRAITLIAQIIGYVVAAIIVIADAVISFYIVYRYGLFTLIFVVPLFVTLAGLVFYLSVAIIAGVGYGLTKVFGAILGARGGSTGDES